MTDRFEEIREAITRIDEEILAAVNARLGLVAELWEIKDERGLPLSDPERERMLRDALAASNRGPLSPDGLERLIDTLLLLMREELRPAAKRAEG
jgi:chorismate mutase